MNYPPNDQLIEFIEKANDSIVMALPGVVVDDEFVTSCEFVVSKLTMEIVYISHIFHADLGFCDYEQEDTPHGLYNWTETEVGQTTTLECFYGSDEDVPDGMASRQCGGHRDWNEYFGLECITENTFILMRLANVSFESSYIQGVHAYILHPGQQ